MRPINLKRLLTHVLASVLLLGIIVPGQSQDSTYTSLEEALKQKENAKMLIIGDVEEPDLTGIDQLPNLTFLKLENNRFKNFPTEVYKLKQLKNLVITQNHFTVVENGTFVESRWTNWINEVPDGIGNMESLEVLFIRGAEITKFSSEFWNLPKLREIYFQNLEVEFALADMPRLKNLEKLSISYDSIKTIPPEFGEMQTLKELSLNGNADMDLNAALPIISRIESLRSLKLASLDLESVPMELKMVAQLEELDLEGNNLTELPDWLAYRPNLTGLRLLNNKISELPSSFMETQGWTYLNLSGNPMNVPLELDKLSQNEGMSSLWIENCELNQFPESLRAFKNLEDLGLRGNKIETIPDWFGEFEKLTYLRISENPLKEGELEKLKSMLPNCEIVN